MAYDDEDLVDDTDTGDTGDDTSLDTGTEPRLEQAALKLSGDDEETGDVVEAANKPDLRPVDPTWKYPATVGPGEQPDDDALPPGWKPFTETEQPAQPAVQAQPTDDALPPGWKTYGQPQVADDELPPGWRSYAPGDAQKGFIDRITEGFKGGYGPERPLMSPEEEQAHPIARALDPALRGLEMFPRLLGGALGAGAGAVAALAEKYGMSPADADRLMRDLGIIGQGVMAEPGASFGPHMVPRELNKIAREAQKPAPPPEPSAIPGTPPANVPEPPPPAQPALPFEQGKPPMPVEREWTQLTQPEWNRFNQLADEWNNLTPEQRAEFEQLRQKAEAGRPGSTDRPQIGGGEAQPELPLGGAAPPGPQPRGIRNQDWGNRPPANLPIEPRPPAPQPRPVYEPGPPAALTRDERALQADLASRWTELTPAEKSKYNELTARAEAARTAPPEPKAPQPELPLEPPPVVDKSGQSGFNITAPDIHSRNAMPDSGGVAKEAVPPRTATWPAVEEGARPKEPDAKPHTAVGRGLVAEAEGRPSESGINVVQPGQVEPTLSAAQNRTAATRPAPTPAEPPRRTVFEPERPPYQPPPLHPSMSPVPYMPKTTQGVAEPPVTGGMTRLYQREGAHPRSFTTERPPGPGRYVDVNPPQLEQMFRKDAEGQYTGHKIWDSPAYQQKLQPLTRTLTEPVAPREPALAPRPPEPPPEPKPPEPKPPEPPTVQPSTPELDAKIKKAVESPDALTKLKEEADKTLEAYHKAEEARKNGTITQEKYNEIANKAVDAQKALVKAEAEHTAAKVTAEGGKPLNIMGRRIAHALQESTFKDMLAKHGTREGLMGDLTRFITGVLNKKIGNMKVYVVSDADLARIGDAGAVGVYYGDKNHIVINAKYLNDPVRMAHAVLHEGIHAVTSHAILTNEKVHATINLVMQDIVKKLHAQGLTHFPEEVGYGFKNEREFLAEAFSNPKFQEMLKNHELSPDVAKILENYHGSKTTPKSAWNAIVETVRNLFKIDDTPRNMSALEAVMRSTEQAMKLNEKAKRSYMTANPLAETMRERMADTDKPHVFGRDKTGDLRFKGDTEEAAAKAAMRAGYKPEQIFKSDRKTPYTAQPAATQAAVATSKGASGASKGASGASKGASTAAPQSAGQIPVAKPRPVTASTLIPDSPQGNKKAFDAANKADDQLHKLSTVPAADAGAFRDVVKKATKLHPDIMGKGGQQIYEAVERGKLASLPAKLRQGYDAATKALRDESKALRQELKDRGIITDKSMDDPNYIHRIVKNFDKDNRVVDPITEGGLPGMYTPSPARELAFRGAQAKDGSRLVVSGKGDRLSLMKDRKELAVVDRTWNTDRPPQTGDKFIYNGKEYTIDRGLTSEIEQHAVHKSGEPVEYHKNALLSAFMENRNLKMSKAYHDWLDSFKGPDSPFHEFMAKKDTPMGKEAEKRGWIESKVPELKGYIMHPDLEQVMHNNYNPGLNLNPNSKIVSAMRAVNQLATRSIFWTPTAHAFNASVHYMIGRGYNLVPYTPKRMANFVKATFEGFDAAITQNKLLQDLNREGASLVMSKIDSQNIGRNLGDWLKTDLKNNPGPIEAAMRKAYLGKGVDAVKLLYDGSSRILWTFSDALMVAAIREAERNGMTREEAIARTRQHMPDYRLPIKFLGSRELVRFMSDKNISMFGRYHMGLVNSLHHMVDTVKPWKGMSMEERKVNFGNILALVATGFLIKPAFDMLAQMTTGNEEAKFSDRGPLGLIRNVGKLATGDPDVDIGKVVSNTFSLSPFIKMLGELYSNENWAHRKIMQPGMSLPEQAGQLAGHVAGSVISPYSTFAPAMMPGSKTEPLRKLIEQITDIKNPTGEQIAAKNKAMKRVEQEARSRAKKPRDPIEYGIGTGYRTLRDIFQ